MCLNVVLMTQTCVHYHTRRKTSTFCLKEEKNRPFLFYRSFFSHCHRCANPCFARAIVFPDQPHAKPGRVCGRSGLFLRPVQPTRPGAAETAGQVCASAPQTPQLKARPHSIYFFPHFTEQKCSFLRNDTCFQLLLDQM